MAAIAAIVLLLIQTPGAPVNQAHAPPSIPAAQARLNAGDAAGARAILEKIVAAAPVDRSAWRLLGAACRQLNDGECAVGAYTKALALRPTDTQTMFDLGVAYAVRNDPDATFLWLDKARNSKRVDMTQMEGLAALDTLRKDPRFASLVPTPDDFRDPFVEPTTIIREWPGEAANDQFGWIARSIGDVDGDKAEDFVTAAPTSNAAGTNAGRIYVYSTRRGSLLWKADGAAGDRLGIGVEAAGDVNRDGAGDVIAAAPGGGYARVYSGRNGAILLTLESQTTNEAFGRHVHGIGDVTGDAVPDQLVGAPGGPSAAADFAGRAYVFSGRDGSLVLTLKGERAGDQFGAAVAGLNAKGKMLIVVGAPRAGINRTGRVSVYTSLTEKAAFTFDADETGNALGAMFLAVPGDFDRDGTLDLFASDFTNAAKGPSTGRIYVRSGASGQQLFALTGETAGEGFGTSASHAGDVDGDGTPDLIVGAWQYSGEANGAGRAYLYSGRTRELLKTFTCRTPGDAFGFDAVGLGDVDGDGVVDLLMTSAWSGIRGFHSGRVFVVSSGVRPVRSR